MYGKNYIQKANVNDGFIKNNQDPYKDIIIKIKIERISRYNSYFNSVIKQPNGTS